MDRVAAAAFPYPTVVDGLRRNGSLVDMHEKCTNCANRECERAEPGDRAAVCHRGLSYRNVRANALIFGVAVKDDPTVTTHQKRAVRSAGADAVSRVDLQRAGDRLDLAFEGRAEESERSRDLELDEYRDSDSYLSELVGKLGPQIEQALGQFHDYRALAGRVLRNLSVYIEQTVQGDSEQRRLENAPHELTAAYFSALLMIDKLDAALFLLRPDMITAQVDAPFRFHGLVSKYAKIYKREMEAKSLSFVQIGDSYGNVHSNSRAVSVLPLNLLDNAVKYAPTGSTVTVIFEETESHISFSVESLGPRIAADERRRIFEPFYRAEAAKATASEGMGFGLAVCRIVAERLGTSIVVRQENEPAEGRYYRTRFTVDVPRSRQ